jgi:hypothetical protein
LEKREEYQKKSHDNKKNVVFDKASDKKYNNTISGRDVFSSRTNTSFNVYYCMGRKITNSKCSNIEKLQLTKRMINLNHFIHYFPIIVLFLRIRYILLG